MKRLIRHQVFQLISDVAAKMGVDAYVIGGWVRDLYLKRQSKDIDIVVIGSGIKLAREVAKKAKISPPVCYKNFGTAKLDYDKLEIEFVGARKESYRSSSRKPVVEEGTLQDDQNRRDFTINALAFSLNKNNFGDLIDPFNGIKDLDNKIIRTPLDPDITFSDDPLRMMRAVRFATQLKFTIFQDTYEAIRKNAERISIVSKERVIDELNKIIEDDKPSVGFRLLFDSGLLKLILPEMCELYETEYINGKGHKNNFTHTLEVLDKVAEKSDNLWLRWAAILHDIAKPATKSFNPDVGWTFHSHEFVGAKMVSQIFKKLKLPLNEKMRYVKKLVQLHLRPIALAEKDVTDSAVRRLLYEAGDDIEDLMILCEADITSKNPAKVKKYLNNFKYVRKKLKEVEEKDRIRNWQPPISGNIIMDAFGIKSGREVGIIKRAIREAILDGIIDNDFDEAFDIMKQKGKDSNLKLRKTKKDFIEEKHLWLHERDNDKTDRDNKSK